ncbi:hypothetical protein PIB30_060070 [Stylosanthes scabra]|uniref:Uncharacterized protein n=1 Tax=Stylosanthes scabra TaxID=79078 RepID=A0ABU6TKS3_9FABA|nr:hypothetical protein [Stylosanthes scabra]
MAGSTAGNGARAADIAVAVMGEGTTVARAGSTETPATARIGQGEAVEAGSACKPHHRRRETLYIHERCDPSSAPRMKITRTCHLAGRNDVTILPRRRVAGRILIRSPPRDPRRRRSRGRGRVARGRRPPDPGPQPPSEYPPVAVLRLLVIIVSARLHIHPPTAGRALTLPQDIRARHRAVERSDLSPESQQGAHYLATEIPWDLAAGNPGSGTDDDRQLPTSQRIPWLANRGGGWARSESDDLGTSGCARSRISMQAHRATTYRRP